MTKFDRRNDSSLKTILKHILRPEDVVAEISPFFSYFFIRMNDDLFFPGYDTFFHYFC